MVNKYVSFMKDQHELYEYARQRVKQKKRLYYHFVVFVLGSIVLYVLNELLGYGEQIIDDWFIIAIIIWSFLFVLHVVNVFITNRFMGNDWERRQTEKLVEKQQNKISKIEKKITSENLLKEESDALNDRLKKKNIPEAEE